MPIDNTASGPATGNAGGGADSLRAALAAAAGETDLSGMQFAEGVNDAPKREEQPGDKTAPEDAADGNTRDAAATAETKTEDKANQPRKADGKFAARDAKAEDQKSGDAPKATDKAPASVTSSAMSAPAHWDAAKREAFGTLPAEGQKIVLDLVKAGEAHLTRKSQEYAEDKRYADGVRQLVTDGHRAQMRAAGLGNEVEGIGFLLKLHDFATQRPGDYVRWVVQQSRLDPRTLFPELGGEAASAPVSDAQGQPIDPRYIQQLVQEQTKPLYQRLQAYDQRERAEEQRRENAAMNSAGDVITKFEQAADESGALKYPHFKRVEDVMAKLCMTHPTIKAIPDMGARLAAAYETAVLADPDLRQEFVNGEVSRAEAARRQRDDVDKARRAAPAIKSSPSASAPAKPGNLKDAMRAAAREVGLT